MTEIRPDYYKSGGLEAFDVIDAFDLDFNLGNAFKYIARAGKKDSKVEDLRKAVTYLNREIEKEEKNQPNWMTRCLGKPVRDCERENKLENVLDSVLHRIESLDDDKKYYLKSLLSGISQEENYLNARSMDKGYTLSSNEECYGYQTEFSKVDIRWLIRDWNVDLNDFEIVEVESDYEAGRQENLWELTS